MDSLIQSLEGRLDLITIDYVASILKNLVSEDPYKQVDTIMEAIEPFLLDAGYSKKQVNDTCQSLAKDNVAPVTADSQLVALEVPTTMQSFIPDYTSSSSFLKSSSGPVDIEWINSKKAPMSQAERDKKEKLELKQQLKQERKERKEQAKLKSLNVPNELEIDPEDYYEELFDNDFSSEQRKLKSRDIKLDSFDLSISGKKIVSNANLLLAYGRRYGLVGRNGVGKSTLLRNLTARALPVPKDISILHVEQEIAGSDSLVIESVLQADKLRSWLLAREGEYLEKLKNCSPEEENLLHDRLRKIYKELELMETDKAESMASMILNGLGFSKEDQLKPTKMFSGGWRMRVALARALFCKPDLLLLDEPTNMLDLPSVLWLQTYLSTQWKKTVLIVSHDRSFLDTVATDILHLHHEQLDVYKGNYTQFVVTKDEKLKNYQREYDNQMAYREHLQSFIDKFRYNASKAAQAQSKIKILEKLPVLKPIPTEPTIKFSFPAAESLSTPVLQLDRVSFGYSESKIILENIDFNLDLSSRIAILGPNGAGKSTFLNVITGNLEPTMGRRTANSRLRFAFFNQHHVDQLDLSKSSLEFIGLKFPGKPEEEYRRQLGLFGISGPLSLQKIGTLSGGQKSRVVFSILNMMNPHILILDEPTNHLDMDSIDALVKAISSFNGGVIVVSHDQKFVSAVCKEIYICKDKKVARYNGTIQEYANSLEVASIKINI